MAAAAMETAVKATATAEVMVAVMAAMMAVDRGESSIVVNFIGAMKWTRECWSV